MAALTAIMKTTAARLSALFLVLFALCATVLVFYMSSLSVRMLTTQTQETIAAEAQVLGRAYQRGGLPLLVRFVETRSRQPGANLYLVADPNGRILSGNVESLDPGVLETDGWTAEPFEYRRFGVRGTANGDDPAGTSRLAHRAVALVLRLPNQMILLVGRRALKRIDNVSEASRRIMGGDLSGRLPVTGSGDEFDRLSENLNGMLARIAKLNDGLKQVSDNIAHDLKTPLTRLRNRAEAALSGKKTAAEYREALEANIAESDHLIRTFNAILMISRLEAGYSAEQTGPVDLAEIVADVVELYEPVAEEQGVALEAMVPATAAVTANRELVAQALSNIVDNAIKYSAGSGDTPKVVVSLLRDAGGVIMEVADNGPGIGEDDRERVTERFVRLEQSRSQPGSGLGLSLAKAVMKFHGGGLELSGRNPGLSVRMVFPGDSRKA